MTAATTFRGGTMPVKRLSELFDVAFRYVAKITPELDFEAGFSYASNGREGVIWTPKELAAIKKLAILISKNGTDLEEDWKLFLRLTIELNNGFYNSNFVPSVLLSQYNSIILKLLQKKNGTIANKTNFLDLAESYHKPDGY
jgi:hypothetical protein